MLSAPTWPKMSLAGASFREEGAGKTMTRFDSYLQDIQKTLSTGNATEHTYRPALKAMLEAQESKITAIQSDGSHSLCAWGSAHPGDQKSFNTVATTVPGLYLCASPRTSGRLAW